MIYPNVDLLTEAEAEAFDLSAQLANKLAELRPVHPAELSECVTAIHDIQKSLLARAAYPLKARHP